MRRLLLPDGEVILRPSRVEDAEGLTELDRTLAEDGRGMVFGLDQVPTPEEWRVRIEMMGREREAKSVSLVAERRGTIAASATLRQFVPSFCSHAAFVALGVHPDAQRRGIGRAMLEMLIEHAKKSSLIRVELYVRDDNHRARALYRSVGFVDEGVRARFIRLPDGRFVDDRTMVLFLDGSQLGASR
jgi:ribosomal protein S18 acetylase RimI-like enzyme